ncbi:hypothetical protein [Psychrobacter sp. 16-MNA-CIBAN-0192]|uniref:hypothetical protein n=1 Tax=Psychrobacter sp. 16-MNA-CIBAN-0192 TaxID=3140448 RepID=UPI00331F5380
MSVTSAGSKLIADNITVDPDSFSALNLNDNGHIKVKNIIRKGSSNSFSSHINFNNGILELAADQSALFDGFNTKNPRIVSINLAAGGGTIDTNVF